MSVCCILRKWLWRMDTSRTRQVRMKVNDDTREKLGQSTKRNATIPRQGGRGSYRGRFICLSTKCGQAESRDFLPAKVCGRSWADLLLTQQSAVLLPSCAYAKSESFFIHIFFWFYLPSWLYHQFIPHKYVSSIKIFSKFF